MRSATQRRIVRTEVKLTFRAFRRGFGGAARSFGERSAPGVGQRSGK